MNNRNARDAAPYTVIYVDGQEKRFDNAIDAMNEARDNPNVVRVADKYGDVLARRVLVVNDLVCPIEAQ